MSDDDKIIPFPGTKPEQPGPDTNAPNRPEGEDVPGGVVGKSVEPAPVVESAKERRERIEGEAVQLALGGWNREQIARQLGISPTRAGDLVEKALRRNESSVETARLLQLARYDMIQRAFWRRGIVDGEPKAMEFVLDAMQRRERLLGLEVQRHELSAGEGGPIVAGAVVVIGADASKDEFVRSMRKARGDDLNAPAEDSTADGEVVEVRELPPGTSRNGGSAS